jgi:hypothetical protein
VLGVLIDIASFAGAQEGGKERGLKGTMDTVSTVAPSQRQVLVNLGNRYVVFGPSASLPQSVRFNPDTDSEVLPRVNDEFEVAETRIAQTLRVAGMQSSAVDKESPQADVVLVDSNGNHVLIELKVRDHDPKARDFEQGTKLLKEAAGTGRPLEVWYFNIERLKLLIMHLDRSDLQIDELVPLNVWERTTEGVFTRACVAEEVNDWIRRIVALYEDVRTWLGDRSNLRLDQSRSVTMSEELMQHFAVADREVPVLDVLEADQVIVSFVPRGLWMMGSWGRIDVITGDQTYFLISVGGVGNLEWRLGSSQDRRQTKPFDRGALLTLLGQQ